MDVSTVHLLNRRCLLTILIILSSLGFSNAQTLFYGDSASIGNGMIKTWVEVDQADKPLRIGVTFTNGVLQNLPNSTIFNSLNFPAVASDSLFKHALVNWNPNGHPPIGIYTDQHFDLHFYMITKAERLSIPGGPDPATINPQFIPQDYINIPGEGNTSVPQMGVHMVDSTAPEFHGEPFTQTFIYGFSAGNMIFVEPMITREYLLTMPQDEISLKQPEAFQRTGYYPVTYKIIFDTTSGDITVELTDLMLHTGVSSVNEVPENPERFELSQNYPNPFNPATTIKYSLNHSSFVSLTITDVLGREVSVLVNEEQPAGSYNLNYNAGNLPSGVYFYTLQTGGLTETRKMILMK